MVSIISKLIFVCLVTLLFVLGGSAQTIESCNFIETLGGKKPISPHIKKRMIKLCIESNKKEFEQLIENTEQVAQLSQEIQLSFDKNNALSAKDITKLKRVEKLIKKIRKELQANSDKNEEEEISTTEEAIAQLKKKTKSLLKEVKKTTRHTVSIAAIQSSNAVLKIVKFLRFKK